MQFTITDLERRTATSYLSGSREGIYARVQFTDGSSYELSRLEGETDWTADASWGPGSFPRWCNGYGARYLITKYVTDAELVAALDGWASRLGKCIMCGSDAGDQPAAGRIGDVTGPMCADCAYWCDGNAFAGIPNAHDEGNRPF